MRKPHSYRSINCVSWAIALALTLCPLRVQAAGDEAETRFRSLFGEDLKRVEATRDKQDDVLLAGELVEVARNGVDDPDLLIVLCTQAYELSSDAKDGYVVAVDAMRLLAEVVPDRRADALSKIVAIRQREYKETRPAANEKFEAGEALVRSQLELGDVQAATGSFHAAEQTLRHALSVASAVKSPLVKTVRTKGDGLVKRQQLTTRLQSLQDKLKSDPKNLKTIEEILVVCVHELDDPSTAAEYLEFTTGRGWKEHIPLALRAIGALSEQECGVLGRWYEQSASESAPSAKPVLLSRAYRYHRRYLELHTAKDIARKEADVSLKGIESLMAKLNVPVPVEEEPAEETFARNEGGSPHTPQSSVVFASARQTDGAGATWVNVLKSLDLSRDIVDGLWIHADGNLHSPAAGLPRIRLPATVEGSYRLEMRFVRLDGESGLALALPVGKKQVVLLLGFGADGVGGLGKIDDQPFQLNPSFFKGFPLRNDQVYNLGVEVKIWGSHAAITCILDGQEILQWTGPQQSLSLQDPQYWETKGEPTVVLGTYAAPYRFDGIKLQKLAGSKLDTVAPQQGKDTPRPLLDVRVGPQP